MPPRPGLSRQNLQAPHSAALQAKHSPHPDTLLAAAASLLLP